MNLLAPWLIVGALVFSTVSEAATSTPARPVQLGLDVILEGRSVLSGQAEGESVSTGAADLSIQGSIGGWTTFANVISPFGNSLTAGPLGDFGVVSNIDVDALPRLQQAWVEARLGESDVRLGMMAADTEFWVSDQASLFHNSAFGAPTFVSASIPNLGVYPSAAFGVRVQKPLASGRRLSMAVVDGDPGDIASENSRGLKVNAGNGVLVLTELADHETDDNGFGTGWKIGGFLHTGDFSPMESLPPKEGNAGVFALIEYRLAPDVFGFLRAGAAKTSRSASPRSVEAGVVIHRPLGLRGVFGLAGSRIRINPFEDIAVPSGERILEATYRLPMADGLAIQADIQHIRPSGGLAGTDSSLVAGLRLYITH